MVTTTHPTWITLHLPLGTCCTPRSDIVSNLNSGQEREGPPAIDLTSSPTIHGCSLVPYARILNIVYKYPHIRQLHLKSVIVQLEEPTRQLTPVPWFSLLEYLTIQPLFTQLSGEGVITLPLPALLARMPRLRKLCVYGPQWPGRLDPGVHGSQYPDLPCILETICLFGALPVSTCTHIISQSRDTLQELRMDHHGTDSGTEALVSALAQAAPRLRTLDLRLGGDNGPLSRYAPVLAALDRAETVDLQTPQHATLQEALDLLCRAPVRALTLRRAFHVSQRPAAAAHVDVLRTMQMHRLRSILLLNFPLDDESRRELVAYCRTRRIRCQIPV